MSWMLTATGAMVDLRLMAHDTISVLDIAHHLAQLNRYTGACRRPYSVAEHSLLVCHIVQSVTDNSSTALLALMHDGHEAYTADLSAPMKQVLGYHWRDHENRIEHAVLKRFDLLSTAVAWRSIIHWADMTALMTERHQLMPATGPVWAAEADFPPIEWDFSAREAFTWSDWRQAFLDKFDELSFGRQQQALRLVEANA